MHGLKGVRIVDFTSEIAGPYATKLFVDAGADVLKIESPAGDPLRRSSSTGADLGGTDGALFRFLNAGKQSIVGDASDAHVRELLTGADLIVEDFTPGAFDVAGVRSAHPGAVVLSITPYGQSGPYAHRPWTEFIVQAEGGSVALRGRPEQEPYQAGGRIAEWVAGAFGAVGALAAVLRARSTGHGEHVDLAMLDAINLSGSIFMDLIYRLMGLREAPWPSRTTETPSIEPTADGWVGFNTNSAQQFADFLVLIERPDLEGEGLETVAGRTMRFDEWQDAVRAWTTKHTTAEIVERASALRIPVAPVNDGKNALLHEHFVARGIFVDSADGSFQHPRRPYLVGGNAAEAPRPAPTLGQHTNQTSTGAADRPPAQGTPPLPFAGLRVLDMTNWWAGPAGTHVLASLGADVIHVESARRPDGVRYTGGILKGTVEEWWECSAFFLAADSNKRDLCIDLSGDRGKEVIERLAAKCDLLVENYSPRVLDGFGLGWERLQELNPRLSLVRMPAFGLDGPWRDNVGFAQTMDQISGLAWVTGHADDQPRIQRGPCDPLAGMNAAFASMVALAERDHTGRGVHVECPMVEGALNAAAEQVIEYTAYGNVPQRMGNRSPMAAPQGIYPCRGHAPELEQWLALSVASDEQWTALIRVLGDAPWTREAALASEPGRRAAHDRIDAELRTFFADRDLDSTVEELVAAGVPAGRVWDTRRGTDHPQLQARGFFETVTHSVAGTHPTPTLPFRYESLERWIRTPAPTLGQNNREILCDLLGLSGEEYDALVEQDVIGTRPAGA
ncbi:MAG: CoA transferase [Candidatus Binatia bacterium]|nr:CoA transferase [Candidatus Binatia bacterium]